MFGVNVALTFNGHLINHFPNVMRAETARNRLRAALAASGIVADGVEYKIDHDRKIKAAGEP